MGKEIGKNYKYSQSQLSTSSLKSPVCSSSASQTPPSIELTTMSVPYVRYKKKNNFVLCSENSIHNDLSIINNDDIQSCETRKNKIIGFQPLQILITMHNVLLPHP